MAVKTLSNPFGATFIRVSWRSWGQLRWISIAAMKIHTWKKVGFQKQDDWSKLWPIRQIWQPFGGLGHCNLFPWVIACMECYRLLKKQYYTKRQAWRCHRHQRCSFLWFVVIYEEMLGSVILQDYFQFCATKNTWNFPRSLESCSDCPPGTFVDIEIPFGSPGKGLVGE